MCNDNIQKRFVNNLSTLMEVNGKNQTDLMHDLNISSATISSWCTGSKFPRPDKIEMLAAYFNVDIIDFFKPSKF